MRCRGYSERAILTLFLTGGLILPAQPVIERITNAASGITTGIAPQMLVSVFGQNLAASKASASGFPLRSQLAGTSVSFNGILAPLLYVSPTQINAQVPTGVQAADQVSVIVMTALGRSNPVYVMVQSSAIGIFTQNGTGCGQLAAFNVHADGSVSLNTPQNSLDPLSDWGLTIFLTGIGAFPDRVDGAPFRFNPADKAGIVARWTTGLWIPRTLGPHDSIPVMIV